MLLEILIQTLALHGGMFRHLLRPSILLVLVITLLTVATVATLAVNMDIDTLLGNVAVASLLGKYMLVAKSVMLPMPEATTNNMTSNEMFNNICHLHFRIHDSHPADELATLFELLDLDHTQPPFDKPEEWVCPGAPLNGRAYSVILLAWSKRMVGLVQRDASVADVLHHLDILELFIQPPTVEVYMLQVLPHVMAMAWGKDKYSRLDVLKTICGGHWNDGSME
ncbi:hypothetical protein CEP54_011472 [Fusarium duplospermum]|uniref:Uncharacterized protein n=1 Tax=Fusarium duplospermum TaxID=1325734 RepID=A0A428PE77_9HYPO|nr:hypothetical protein CEP54_011472 [Fusarium duplospermum]